ncbi:hypothetical protein ACLB1N_04160 [Escherichia coli]
MGTEKVRLTGGEPSLRRDFYRYHRRCAGKRRYPPDCGHHRSLPSGTRCGKLARCGTYWH